MRPQITLPSQHGCDIENEMTWGRESQKGMWTAQRPARWTAQGPARWTAQRPARRTAQRPARLSAVSFLDEASWGKNQDPRGSLCLWVTGTFSWDISSSGTHPNCMRCLWPAHAMLWHTAKAFVGKFKGFSSSSSPFPSVCCHRNTDDCLWVPATALAPRCLLRWNIVSG